MLYQWSKNLLLQRCPYKKGQVIYENDKATVDDIVKLEANGVYEVTVVAGGGNGYNKFLGEGVYTHAATGGSGSAFVGEIPIIKGSYAVTVGGATQNSSAIGVTAYAGATAVYNNGGGAGGALPTIPDNVVSTTLHSAGNKGNYGRGGDGGDPAWIVGRTPSVYQPDLRRDEGNGSYTWKNTNYGYGAGNSCYSQEYKRTSLPALGGYVKIVYVRFIRNFVFEIRPNIPEATVIINGQETKSFPAYEGTVMNYSVSLDGYTTQTGSVKLTNNVVLDIELTPVE